MNGALNVSVNQPTSHQSSRKHEVGIGATCSAWMLVLLFARQMNMKMHRAELTAPTATA